MRSADGAADGTGEPDARRRRGALARRVAVALALGAVAALALVQARRALHHRYDLVEYLAAGEAILAGGFDTDAWRNSWPPFFSLLLVPLAWLARALPAAEHHRAVVILANLGWSAALVVLSTRAASPARRPGAGAYAAVALLAAPYLRENLLFHQVNAALATLCVIAFARAGSHRDDAMGGGLVGLAASAKVQPALLLPWFWRRPRALLGAVAVGAACAVAPALVYGPATLWRAWRFWLEDAIPRHVGGYGVSLSAAAHNLACLLAGAPVTPLPRRPLAEGLGTALALAAVVALQLAVARRARRGPRQPPLLDLAVLLPAAVLATPLAWRYHLVALVPAQAALVVYLSRPTPDVGRRRRVVALLATGVTLGYLPELGALRSLDAAVEWLLAMGLLVAASAALVGAVLVARGDAVSDAFRYPAEAPPPTAAEPRGRRSPARASPSLPAAGESG